MSDEIKKINEIAGGRCVLYVNAAARYVLRWPVRRQWSESLIGAYRPRKIRLSTNTSRYRRRSSGNWTRNNLETKRELRFPTVRPRAFPFVTDRRRRGNILGGYGKRVEIGPGRRIRRPKTTIFTRFQPTAVFRFRDGTVARTQTPIVRLKSRFTNVYPNAIMDFATLLAE